MRDYYTCSLTTHFPHLTTYHSTFYMNKNYHITQIERIYGTLDFGLISSRIPGNKCLLCKPLAYHPLV